MKYKFNERGFVFREEQNGALLFNRKTNMFYNLNYTAAEIIKGITQSRTSASILSRIIMDYNIPNENDFKKDSTEFLEQMLKDGVISVDKSYEDLYKDLTPLQEYRHIKIEEMDFIKRNLPDKRSTIINLGCNSGYDIKYFSENHYVFGFDKDFDAIKKSEEGCKVITADIKFLPLKREYADIALLTGHVLGYLEKEARESALKRIHESIAKNGKFIFGVWTQKALFYSEFNIKDLDMIEAKDREEKLYELHFFSEPEINEITDMYEYIDDVLFLSRNGEFGNEYVTYCCRKC